jgi:hypothetical protein
MLSYHGLYWAGLVSMPRKDYKNTVLNLRENLWHMVINHGQNFRQNVFKTRKDILLKELSKKNTNSTSSAKLIY